MRPSPTLRRVAWLSISGGFVAIGLAWPRAARAQEIILTRPLKVPPFAPVLWRARRLEVAALPGIRVLAGGHVAALWGAQIRYYPWDRFGVGLWGSGETGLGTGCSPSCAVLAAPEVTVVPVAGKLKFLEYLPYGMHLVLGAAWEWPHSSGGPRLAPSFGGGVAVFSASWFSSSLDYRAVPSSVWEHFVTFSFAWWPLPRGRSEP